VGCYSRTNRLPCENAELRSSAGTRLNLPWPPSAAKASPCLHAPDRFRAKRSTPFEHAWQINRITRSKYVALCFRTRKSQPYWGTYRLHWRSRHANGHTIRYARVHSPVRRWFVQFCERGFRKERTITPDDRSQKAGDWSDYPVGVLRELRLFKLNHLHFPCE
jgi:hypothetical protein